MGKAKNSVRYQKKNLLKFWIDHPKGSQSERDSKDGSLSFNTYGIVFRQAKRLGKGSRAQSNNYIFKGGVTKEKFERKSLTLRRKQLKAHRLTVNQKDRGRVLDFETKRVNSNRLSKLTWRHGLLPISGLVILSYIFKSECAYLVWQAWVFSWKEHNYISIVAYLIQHYRLGSTQLYNTIQLKGLQIFIFLIKSTIK